jgi:hypothetical protein
MSQVVIEDAVFFNYVIDMLQGAYHLSLRAGGARLHELLPYYVEYNFIIFNFFLHLVWMYNLFVFCLPRKSF